MKAFIRAGLAVCTVPVAAAFLLGCPKKVEVAEPTPQPKVSEAVITTKSQAPSGREAGSESMTAGAGEQARERQEEQKRLELMASRGEDIPIQEAPTVEFVDPSAEEKAILRTVYFDYDKSVIRQEFQTVLEGIAKWMAGAPARQLLVEGHCDERGTDEYNLALGERRALAVRRYLIGLGVAADRLHTISYGEESPAALGHDESAWVKNRRAEFKVSAK